MDDKDGGLASPSFIRPLILLLHLHLHLHILYFSRTFPHPPNNVWEGQKGHVGVYFIYIRSGFVIDD